MKFICTLITVSDIERSRYFYEHLLNLRVKNDFGENIVFEGDFAIHLRSHFKGLINHKTVATGQNNVELYFEHNDLELLVDKLKANGIEFVHKIEIQPWQQKVVRFYDPDRYIVEIGESMEHLCLRLSKDGLTLEQITKATSLSLNFVKSVLSDKK
jgi:catechol 2,3-dioxygenase-like lactoylglutathione lyase family enzyme